MRAVTKAMAVMAAVLCGGTAALAQTGSAPAAFAPSTGHPGRDTLLRMSRPITIEFEGNRLEEVMKYLIEVSGADLEPLWADDRNSEGLDKDFLVTMKAERLPMLTLLEKILDEAKTDFSENTWQLTPFGTMEVGPKSRLNKRKRVQIYDVNDMLVEIPTYDQVPQIDLQSVLQSGQGGGSGQSPFRDNQQDMNNDDRRSKQDRAQEIIDLLVDLVEPDQWQDRGGEGGSIRYFQGHIIVNAPDYMHRQIDGYAFWPQTATRFVMNQGRRYVSLNMDAATSVLRGFGQEPVTAVVGGRLIRSDRPGGGG